MIITTTSDNTILMGPTPLDSQMPQCKGSIERILKKCLKNEKILILVQKPTGNTPRHPSKVHL